MSWPIFGSTQLARWKAGWKCTARRRAGPYYPPSNARQNTAARGPILPPLGSHLVTSDRTRRQGQLRRAGARGVLYHPSDSRGRQTAQIRSTCSGLAHTLAPAVHPTGAPPRPASVPSLSLASVACRRCAMTRETKNVTCAPSTHSMQALDTQSTTAGGSAAIRRGCQTVRLRRR